MTHLDCSGHPLRPKDRVIFVLKGSYFTPGLRGTVTDLSRVNSNIVGVKTVKGFSCRGSSRAWKKE